MHFPDFGRLAVDTAPVWTARPDASYPVARSSTQHMAGLMGLFLAVGTSVMNVATDVSRKKALAQNDLFITTFWIRLAEAVTISLYFAWRIYRYGAPHFSPDLTSPLAHWTSLLSPGTSFFLYLLVDVTLVAIAELVYFRALQISDLSLSAPFLALTPAMLVLTGAMFLHEMPCGRELLGILLVVTGSVLLNPEGFREGLLGPARILFRNPGARYMFCVALLLSISNPLDKKLVLMSDPSTQAFGYVLLLWILLTIITVWMRSSRPWLSPLKSKPLWLLSAGLFDTFCLLLQLNSHIQTDVVITVTIKRAGIILSVLCGWIFFHEKHVVDRLLASTIMIAGVIAIYFPISFLSALALVCVSAIVCLLSFHRAQWQIDSHEV